MTPKISVLIAAHNAEDYVNRSITSILKQTFQNFELIVIDDASSDKTLQIIKDLATCDSRIVIIENSSNIGLTKSLNKGLNVARGKYIARLDIDDIALPERLKIQFDYLESHPDIFLLGGGIIAVTEKGRSIVHKPITKNLHKELENKNCIFHPTIMFRNNGLKYREKFTYAQDYDYYLMLISQGMKVANIPDILVYYNVAPNTISSSKKSQQDAFADIAKIFYKERTTYGKDTYDSFNPETILNKNIFNSKEKKVLNAEICAQFRNNNFVLVRRLAQRYFRHHGMLNKNMIYYICTYLGQKNVSRIRRIKDYVHNKKGCVTRHYKNI